MGFRFPVLCFVLFGALIAGCQGQEESASESVAGEVEISDGNDVVSNEKEFLIDVRSQEEWDRGHLPGAILIPHKEIGDRIGEVTTDKTARLVLY